MLQSQLFGHGFRFALLPTSALTCAGAIPPELGKLTSLEDLVMPYNELSGKLSFFRLVLS